MTTHFTLPRQRADDDNGNIVAGAKLYFFDEGTTNPRTVYSDYTLNTAHGVFVQADANGYFDPIFPPYGNYDVIMTDGTDAGNDYTAEATIRAKITTQGPVDLTAFQSTIALSKTTSETVAIDTTIVAADQGKAYDCNPTSGSITITLPSASGSGIGDGFEITVKHIGTANAVLISTVNAELIDTLPSIAITRTGSSVTLRSNGANWKIKCETVTDLAMNHIIADRTLTSPPTTPAIGDKYIMPSGTLTGLWSVFSTNDIVIYLGSGVYKAITKIAGDRAYIEDENLDSRWTGSAWEDLSNITAPNSSVLETATFSYEVAQNTAGGTSTAHAWTARDLTNESSGNNITGLVFDETANTITLPIGTYLVTGSQTHRNATRLRLRLKSTTTDNKVDSPILSGVEGMPTLVGILNVTAEETFKFEYYRDAASGSSDMGSPLNTAGETEKYASLTIVNLSSLQGPQGIEGPQGAAGADGADGADGSNGTDGLDGVSAIYSQSAEPAGGNNGDLWIDSDDGQLYQKIASVWTDTGTNLTGPTGPTGATGATGATGGGLADLVDDTTPQLGGTLDCNGNVVTDFNIGSDAAGDILYHNGTAYTRLAAGTNGHVLKLSSGLPSWAPESGGSGATSLQVYLNSIAIAELKGDRINLPDGIVDPFSDETDVDTATSTNETYDATNDFYSPSGGSGGAITVTSYIGDTTAAGGIATVFDGTTSQGKSVGARKLSSLSCYFGADLSAAPKAIGAAVVYGSNDAGFVNTNNPNVTLILRGKNGSAPADRTDGTSIGTLATFADTADESGGRTMVMSDTSTMWDYVWIDFSRDGSASDDICIAELSLTESSAINNMTLQSNAFTADSTPASARVVVQARPNEAITVNTDLIASVSRDGGTTFTAATLVEMMTDASGFKIYEHDGIDISSQPSGTSMKWKIATANNKDIDVSAIAFDWS